MSTDKCAYILFRTSPKVIGSNLNEVVFSAYSNKGGEKKKENRNLCVSIFTVCHITNGRALKWIWENIYLLINHHNQRTLMSIYYCLSFPVSQTSPSVELQTKVNELPEKAMRMKIGNREQDFFTEDKAPHSNSLKWQVWWTCFSQGSQKHTLGVPLAPSVMNIEHTTAHARPRALLRFLVSIPAPFGTGRQAIFLSQVTSLPFLIEMAQFRNAENAVFMQCLLL